MVKAKKYKYKNLKHVKLHGIEPYGIGEFDHPILGGGIELISGPEEKVENITEEDDIL